MSCAHTRPRSAGHGPNDPLTGAHSTPGTPGNPLPHGGHHGTQPAGSWIGVEHGTRLDVDPRANAVADDVLHRASSAEADITRRIRSVIDGASPQGAEFALKSHDSLKRKIATELTEFPCLTPEAAAGRIRDAVRSTMEIVCEPHSVCVSVRRPGRVLRVRFR
jgi:hypothetical protein